MAYFVLASFWILMLYAAILVAGFVAIMLILQPPLTMVGWHVGVGAVLFIIGFVLFATGLFGGGDVKVIAALGLWLGPLNIFSFLMLMAIFGGALAALLLIFRRIKIPQSWLESSTIKGWHSKEEGIPYGVAIAIAALIEFPKTEIYSQLTLF